MLDTLIAKGGGLIFLLVVYMSQPSPFIEGAFQQKPIFRYVSSNNDLENSVEIIKTNYETTYHTFDFNTNTITLQAPSGDGKWKTFKYRFTHQRTLPNSVMEFDVDHPACYQVWVDAVGSIGYELTNGQKLVFYDIKKRRD